VSDLNKKIYATIEAWRNRPIEGEHPYMYLDGIVLKRSWAGEVRNVSLLVAIAVNSEGYREILGICEGAKEDKAGWSAFLKHLKERGLAGVKLIISDACLGLSESAAEFFPEAAWQRCIVGSLKKSGQTDSVIASDSRSAGMDHAWAQGAGSTGAAYHWLATTAHS
jgi:putative transposase